MMYQCRQRIFKLAQTTFCLIDQKLIAICLGACTAKYDRNIGTAQLLGYSRSNLFGH